MGVGRGVPGKSWAFQPPPDPRPKPLLCQLLPRPWEVSKVALFSIGPIHWARHPSSGPARWGKIQEVNKEARRGGKEGGAGAAGASGLGRRWGKPPGLDVQH